MMRVTAKAKRCDVCLLPSCCTVILCCISIRFLLPLSFRCLSAFKISQGDVFANGNCKPISKSCCFYLLPFQSHYLCRQRPRIEVTLPKLAVKVRPPRIDSPITVNCSCKARLLFANLNVTKENSIHTNLLRCAEYAKLSRTPDY